MILKSHREIKCPRLKSVPVICNIEWVNAILIAHTILGHLFKQTRTKLKVSHILVPAVFEGSASADNVIFLIALASTILNQCIASSSIISSNPPSETSSKSYNLLLSCPRAPAHITYNQPSDLNSGCVSPHLGNVDPIPSTRGNKFHFSFILSKFTIKVWEVISIYISPEVYLLLVG